MKRETLFFLLSPDGIARYMMTVLVFWGISYKCCRSPGNSWYIKLELGTYEQPLAVHIRISNHDSVHAQSLFDYDVLCAAARGGTRINPVTYPRLLQTLAVRLDRRIPPLCKTLLEYGKAHSVELQHNRRHKAWRTGSDAKFFVTKK